MIVLTTTACSPMSSGAGPPSDDIGPTGCDGHVIEAGAVISCEVPGHPDAAVDVWVPNGYSEGDPWPVVVAFHGGGGDRVAAARTTCPGGDLDDHECLHHVGVGEGFFTVYPDGTPNRPGGRFRTWNAGGAGDLDCVAGAACEADADHVAYTEALLGMLAEHYSVESRVVVTGLSNGGAMAHRLGCDLAERVRVVVAIAGTNQHPGCRPVSPITVVQVHGTEDSRWPYHGGRLSALADRARVTGAEETVDDWAETLECGPATEVAIADTSDDGMTSTRFDRECEAGVTVTLIRIDGGGHTWPQGYQYVSERRVGGITQDFSLNELIAALAS